MSSGSGSGSHEKKHRSLRVQAKPSTSSTTSTNNTSNTTNTTASTSSIIAAPPRAALHGRQQHTDDDNSSSKPAAPQDGVTNTSSSDLIETPPPQQPQPQAQPQHQNPPHHPHHTSKSSKDTRIAELETDLASITSEFSLELTSLSQKLTNESESALFWQQKHSSLNQTFLKTDTDLRLLKQELLSLHASHESANRDIKTRVSSLMLDRDAFREAYNEAMGELRSKEDEVRKLQAQVRGLKSWVSSSSKMDEQVTDEAFGERMQRLGNSLQNWVITNFRRVRIDTERVNDETLDLLMQLVPTYSTLAKTSKIHLIQSLVSRIIVERVFLAYFVGLSQERAEELESVEKHLANYGTLENMNQWRSATLTILRKEAPEKLAEETNKMIESLVQQINSIMTAISDIQPSEVRDQALRTVIISSIELSRLLRVQKAVFSILMPCIEAHQQTMFDPACMEDIGGEDEDSLAQREIQCVTFPGIVKSGDENGERSHLRNVVAKIRVLCAPD